MTDSYPWEALIDKHIVQGQQPDLTNPRDTEEPETYLQRLYREAGSPPAFRRILATTLKRMVTGEGDLSALRRALRLAKLIPHPDFSKALSDVFLVARSRVLGDSEPDVYREVTYLALRALYALQPVDEQLSGRQSFLKVMWLALLEDSEYRIPAYNGLLYLDVSLALKHLPLLLRHPDGIPFGDLGVLLRSSQRDLARRRDVDPVAVLAGTMRQLGEDEIAKYDAPFREAFGDSLVEGAVERARKEEEEELGQAVMFTKEASDRPLLSFRETVFPKLAKWLRERVRVRGVSLWLVDEKKEVAHFMAREGLEGELPPNRLHFDEYTTGNIAKSQPHQAWLVSLDDPACKTWNPEKYLKAGLRGQLAVREQAEGDEGPLMALVVNFFDETVERLGQLREACVRSTEIVVRVAQRAWSDYTNSLVAHLAAKKLPEEPGLSDAARTLAEVARRLFKNVKETYDRETVNLYLYDPDLRCLSLSARSDPPGVAAPQTPAGEKCTYSLQEGLAGYTARKTEPVRIFNTFKAAKLDDEIRVAVEQDLSRPELKGLHGDKGVSYLSVPLLEAAPSDFTGRLVGLIEVYRPSKETGEREPGGRVFTPLGQDLLAKLARAATPSITSALGSEVRPDEPSDLATKEGIEQLYGTHLAADAIRNAEDYFRAEANELLRQWRAADAAERRFYAFRTIQDRCKPFWFAREQPAFEAGERAARRALQQAVLAHDDDLIKRAGPAVTVTRKLLADYGVAPEHRERLLSLGLVLVPLIDDARAGGLIGLEFDSAGRAAKAAEAINAAQQEAATQFVRASMMRYWREHRRHLRLLFATFLRRLLEVAVQDGKVASDQHFRNFVGLGRPSLEPREEKMFKELKTFGGLTELIFREPSPDNVCRLMDECQAWEDFASSGQLKKNIPSVKLLAMPSAVRMVLATSTIPMLWGGEAELSLLEDGEGAQSGWSHLRIRVPPNGHEAMRRQGLELARGIIEYRGWSYNDLKKDDKKDDEITVTLPYAELGGPAAELGGDAPRC